MLRGMLWVLAPIASLLGRHDATEPSSVVAWAVSAGFVASALLLPAVPRIARVIATGATLVFAALFTLPRIERPGWGFLVLFGLSLVLTRIWPAPPLRRNVRLPFARRAVPGAVAAALVLSVAWFYLTIGRLVPGWVARPEIHLAALVPGLLALLERHRPPDLARRIALGASVAFAGAGLALVSAGQASLASGFPLAAAASALLATRTDDDDARDVGMSWVAILQHPPRLLVVTFVVQCLIGGMMLTLPAAAHRGSGATFIDALFTSVSATCVTGLAVVDTELFWSPFGEVIILVLIQVGGLGIMTFSAAAFVALARKMSFRAEATAADLIGAENVAELNRALWRVLAVTFITEGIGATILALRFWADGDPPARALWHGVFTAVSAFCNAGFGLRTDNLVHYADQPIVLHTVAALIVIGGIGPAVIVAVPRLLRARTRKRITVHAALALEVTAVLLIVPTVLIAALEWNHALAHLGALDKLHNAWFQSVTLRTAGFNSIDFNHLAPATVSVMMIAMFIGGSPGSTAGGVKTTTVAVLLLAVRAAIEGRTEVEVHRRNIPHEVIYRAGAITTLFTGAVVIALMALQTTQAMDLQTALFEIISATGTVGLTIGGTPKLDDFGKIIIICCMFAGRVGPLTLFLLLNDTRSSVRTHLPQESVPVG